MHEKQEPRGRRGVRGSAVRRDCRRPSYCDAEGSVLRLSGPLQVNLTWPVRCRAMDTTLLVISPPRGGSPAVIQPKSPPGGGGASDRPLYVAVRDAMLRTHLALDSECVGTVKKGSVLLALEQAESLEGRVRVRLCQVGGGESLGWSSLSTDVGFPILAQLSGQQDDGSLYSTTGDVAVRSAPGKSGGKVAFQSGHYAATIRKGTIFRGLETRQTTLTKTVTWENTDSSQVASHFRGKTGMFHSSRATADELGNRRVAFAVSAGSPPKKVETQSEYVRMFAGWVPKYSEADPPHMPMGHTFTAEEVRGPVVVEQIDLERAAWLLPEPMIETNGSTTVTASPSSQQARGCRVVSSTPTVLDHISAAFCQNMDYRRLISCGKMTYGRALVLLGMMLVVYAVLRVRG